MSRRSEQISKAGKSSMTTMNIVKCLPAAAWDHTRLLCACTRNHSSVYLTQSNHSLSTNLMNNRYSFVEAKSWMSLDKWLLAKRELRLWPTSNCVRATRMQQNTPLLSLGNTIDGLERNGRNTREQQSERKLLHAYTLSAHPITNGSLFDFWPAT